MSLITHELKITSLPDVWDVERTIPVDNFDTVSEQVGAGHFKSETASAHAANATRNVRLNRLFRDAITADVEENGRLTLTVEDLRKMGNDFTYGERAATTATGGKKVAEKVNAKLAAVAQDEDIGLTPEQIAKLVAKGYMADPNAPKAEEAPKPSRRPKAAK